MRFILFAWAISTAAATMACPEIPPLRHDEDHHELHAQGCDTLNPLSHVVLGDSGERHMSFGGEVRQRYEYTHNPGFGAEPQDAHGVWLHRYALHSDLHWHDRLRSFVELHSALENGRAAGPSPVDENKLEFQNAFLEARFSLAREGDIHVRAGRQEIQLGSARLISVRDGPNVRRTFDGLRIVADTGSWTFNAIAVRPRRDRNAAFDDSTDTAQLLWGVYATRTPDEQSVVGLDAYYLVREDDEAAYDQGIGSERRQSLGLRFFGSNEGLRWNIEPIVQFGHFGGGKVRAWTIASETGYTWSNWKWQPTLKLSANVASGDRDRSDSDLEAFDALYPRGNYFSEDAILGPRNFYNIHPFLTLHPSSAWALTVDYNFFWRMSTRDGVYRPNGSLLRAGEGSRERFVATALSLTSEWTLNRHLSFTAIYTHFSPRDFLKRTGPSETVEFLELTARFKF